MSNSPNEAVSNLTATVGDDLEWLLKISIPVFLGVNSMSLVLSVLAMSFFLLGRIKNQKLFDRASLQIVLGLVIANTVFHTSYIISLYIQENVACKLTMFGYLFGSLFGCFLISALAINLMIITFATFAGDERVKTPWLLFLTAVLVALGFSVAFIVISPVYYNELYGCWFVDDSQTVSWVCYYGPLFVISILNLAMALAIYLRLKNHERSMDDRKSILSSIFGVFSVTPGGGNREENVVPFICDAPVGGKGANNAKTETKKPADVSRLNNSVKKQSVRRSVISDGSATNNDEAGEQEGDDDHNDSLVSIAMKVNLYLLLPFITEIGVCVVDTLNSTNYLTLILGGLQCLKGTLTFLVLLLDPAIQQAVRQTFS